MLLLVFNDIKIWFFICGFFGYFLIGVEIIEFNLFIDFKVGKYYIF